MKNKVEILAPAGSMESLKASIAAGADAVYTGGMMFGARAYAHNLSKEELLEAIDYVHLHGRKLYLTVNTLIKEREMENELYEYLLPYYEQGLDAVIVQDIGVFRFIKEHFPGLALHASTQMTIAGIDGAKLLEREGAERVVTSRELSIEEVKKIADETDLEIESFVHGALCYCYSGQCLFSSFLGGRSGNRGQCAQPCRLLYQAEGEKKSRYLLSLKDICTLEMIPELVEAGIDSFKIEGRMKKPEYAAAVSYLYRKYADIYFELLERCPARENQLQYAKDRFRVDERDKEMLLDLYNRGGFHTGYFHTHNGRDMVSLNRPNHAGVPAVKVLKKQGRTVTAKVLIDLSSQDVIELPVRKGQEKADNYTCREAAKKGSTIQIPVFADTPFQKDAIWNRTRNEKLIKDLHDRFVDRKIKEKLHGKFILSVGDYATLTVCCGDVSVTVSGDKVQEALNQPMAQERIEKQLRKTGNTEFEFENLEIEIRGNGFLPMQSLNDIRRTALEKLEEAIVCRYRRTGNAVPEKRDKTEVSKTEKISKRSGGSGINASALSIRQMEVLLESELIERIYADCTAFEKIWETDRFSDIIERAHQNNKEIYLIMPYVFREGTRRLYEKGYSHIFEAGWDGILIRNYESFEFLRKQGFAKTVITDYNLYQFNRYGKAFWKEEGAGGFTASPELTEQELAELGVDEGEVIIYGHIPMMVSAGCIQKTLGKCNKKPGQMTITDRYRKKFMVKNECDYCYNVIYNHVPLYLADKMDEVRKINPGSMRLMFTVESQQETKRILDMYQRNSEAPEGEFTRGHWKRGIK